METRDLCKHKMIHSKEKTETCEACGQMVTEAGILRSHEHMHIENEPDKNIAKVMFVVKYSQRQGLQKSHEKRHSEEKFYYCMTCSKIIHKYM